MANPARRPKASRQHDSPPDGPHRVLMGAAADQNARRRRRMEDAHSMHPTLSDTVDFTFMAVFDGHGGGTAAEWCGERAHEYVGNELRVFLGDQGTSGRRRRMVEQCLDKAFARCDEAILADPNIASGCTVAACLIDWTDHRVPDIVCVWITKKSNRFTRLIVETQGQYCIEMERRLDCRLTTRAVTLLNRSVCWSVAGSSATTVSVVPPPTPTLTYRILYRNAGHNEVVWGRRDEGRGEWKAVLCVPPARPFHRHCPSGGL